MPHLSFSSPALSLMKLDCKVIEKKLVNDLSLCCDYLVVLALFSDQKSPMRHTMPLSKLCPDDKVCIGFLKKNLAYLIFDKVILYPFLK